MWLEADTNIIVIIIKKSKKEEEIEADMCTINSCWWRVGWWYKAKWWIFEEKNVEFESLVAAKRSWDNWTYLIG